MTLKRSFLAVLLAGFSLGHSRAQAPDSPIAFQGPGAITETLVDPPVVGRIENPGGRDNNTQWLKVEFHFSVKPKDGGAPFVDAVEFRVWVEGRDLYDPTAKTAEGSAVALTGTVTYVNLAASRDAYGCFYVPPSAMARYGSKNGPSDFTDKFNVHVEAYVGGTKVDYFDKNKEQDPAWFSALHAVAGEVCRQDQCVFMVSDPSRYPQIKLSSSGQ